MRERNYICYNEEMKLKINKLINFINKYRWKTKYRDYLIQLLYVLEALLYADYRLLATRDFSHYCERIRFLYESVEHLFSKELRQDIYNCIEYFEGVAVMLELSKEMRLDNGI